MIINNTGKTTFFKSCYRPIWLMCQHITLKQFNSLTTIKTFSWLGGLDVTQQTAMIKSPCWIPGLDKDFYVHINDLVVFWALHDFFQMPLFVMIYCHSLCSVI